MMGGPHRDHLLNDFFDLYIFQFGQHSLVSFPAVDNLRVKTLQFFNERIHVSHQAVVGFSFCTRLFAGWLGAANTSMDRSTIFRKSIEECILSSN